MNVRHPDSIWAMKRMPKAKKVVEPQAKKPQAKKVEQGTPLTCDCRACDLSYCDCSDMDGVAVLPVTEKESA